MGIISLVIPQIGQPDTTEDVKVQNAFTTIQTVINGNIDSTNLSAATSQSACVNASGQTVKGSSIIAASQSTSSAAYFLLASPDQVTNVVLPTNGLLAVWYQATWQESVSSASTAAIFLGANQLHQGRTNSNLAQSADQTGSTPNTPTPLTTNAVGLTSVGSTSAYPGDVTTGQVIGSGAGGGGPCYIFAVAGTYTISVQFKASSGTVTVSNRRLYVQAISFA